MSKRELLAQMLERTGLGSLLSLAIGRWRGLLVFNYHRVGNAAASPFDHALWSASQEAFDQQVKFLKQNFDVIRVADLEHVLHCPDAQGVMITFDDGYRDNYELAFPVLQRHNVPATFFIASGFLDDRPIAWWDEIAWMVHASASPDLAASQWTPPLALSDREETIRRLLRLYKQLPADETAAYLGWLAGAAGTGRAPAAVADPMWMTWDMVREMDRAGKDIGGHTVTHPVLANVDADAQEREIVLSKRRIEAEIGHAIEAFSYPVGSRQSFNAVTQALLEEAGYRWAFSFDGGFFTSCRRDLLDLPRVAVSPHVSQQLFQSTARLPWLFA
jgi:peptidoglycan/xylan/chitin deacetylase (PgdA/CDA1 family)